MIKKLFFGYLAVVFILVGICYAAWDETKPADTATVAAGTTATRANFAAINTVFGTELDAGSISGIRLPSGAIFYMITGSCPTGSTDVTSTYSNKFIKINATQGTSSGVVLTGTSDSHTLTTAEMPAHVHAINESKRGGYVNNNEFYTVATGGGSPTTLNSQSTGGGGGHTHTLSSATTLEPSSITAILCQVN